MDKWEIMETHPYYNLKGNKPLVTKGPSLGGRRHKIRLPTCTHRDPLGKGACQRMKTNKEQLSPNPLEFNTLGLQEHPGAFFFNMNFHHLTTKRIGKKWKFPFFFLKFDCIPFFK
jgi:hypothetical protein